MAVARTGWRTEDFCKFRRDLRLPIRATIKRGTDKKDGRNVHTLQPSITENLRTPILAALLYDGSSICEGFEGLG